MGEVTYDFALRSARLRMRGLCLQYAGQDERALDDVEQLVQEFTAAIGPPEKLPEEIRHVLVHQDGEYLDCVAAIWLAASEAADRKEYERLLGLYESGYKSPLRSSVMRDFSAARDRGLSMSEWRRTLRRVYDILSER
jgi:hypothetical protein